jgi:predicted nucleic acid-binding Zn finger protein
MEFYIVLGTIAGFIAIILLALLAIKSACQAQTIRLLIILLNTRTIDKMIATISEYCQNADFARSLQSRYDACQHELGNMFFKTNLGKLETIELELSNIKEILTGLQLRQTTEKTLLTLGRHRQSLADQRNPMVIWAHEAYEQLSHDFNEFSGDVFSLSKLIKLARLITDTERKAMRYVLDGEETAPTLSTLT